MPASPLIKENDREMTMTNRLNRRRALWVAWMALLAFALMPAAVSRAAIDVTSFDASLSSNVAGAPADLSIDMSVARGPDQFPVEELRRVKLDLPAGFVGNARTTPTCAQFEYFTTPIPACPATSQVGHGEAVMYLDPTPGAPPFEVPITIYNMEPGSGQAARLGFVINTFGDHIRASIVDIEVRDGGDYGVTATARPLARPYPISGMRLTLWGVPADHGVPVARRAFMTNATSCDGPATVSMAADSYQSPGEFTERSSALPALEDCAGVPFAPTIAIQPDSTVADAPTGLRVDLSVPQSEDPDDPVSSALRDTRVTLPAGMTISPSAADGLVACSDAQFAKTSGADHSCPLASRIGTVSLDVPSLRESLTGHIHVGEQLPGDPYRILLAAKGAGVNLKLAGSIAADPVTGRLTTTFDESPNVPFSKLSLKFKGGSRAPLANPAMCGEKTATAVLTPWSGNGPATVSDAFAIDCPGMGGLSPAFSAGTTNPVGGSFSPFAVTFGRDDREQFLSGVSLELPEGLLAKLGGVPLCPDAQAAAGTCGPESRVGTATVGAGPGAQPFFLDGGVHLTGPYKGAPYGLAVAVRAIAGPYDLGTVVVRQALHVDPVDAHVTVVSDPLPTILEGIPLRLRSVNVAIDRPGFTVNPTSCAEKEIAGVLGSTAGSTANVSSRFQVGDCAALAFTPRLAMRLVGRGQRREGGHPGLRAVLRQPSGQAANKRVKVALPKSLALDPDNAKGLCSYEDGLKGDCSIESKIGIARAHSPLLNRPLKGRVHFVQGVRFDKKTGNRIRTLPTLLIKLRGEIDIDLRANSSVAGGKLVTTFPAIPDAPISKFELRLRGGKGGILAATGRPSLCGWRQIATVDTDAHNGKRRDFRVRMKTPCGKHRR